MIEIWPIIVGLLTVLGSCADRYLESIEPRPVAQLEHVLHTGLIPENQYVFVSGVEDSWGDRVLVRNDGVGNEHTLAFPLRHTRCLGEALVVRETRWWYTRCTDSGIQFVTSDAPDSPRVIAPPDDSDPRKWIPFEQDEPGGVLLSVERDERTVAARRVTASGVQGTLGRFDRGSAAWSNDRGEAVPLRDGVVALITLETISSEPVRSSIVLRVIADGEVVVTLPMAFHASGWEALAAATGPDGTLAIAASPFNRSGIVTVLVDPARPDEATVRQIPDSAGALPGLRLIAGDARFVAGWIDQAHRAVRLVEFDGDSMLPAVVVASRAGGANPAVSLQRVGDEDDRDLAIFWTDAGGNVMMRRLPNPPTEALLAEKFLRVFSSRARQNP